MALAAPTSGLAITPSGGPLAGNCTHRVLPFRRRSHVGLPVARSAPPPPRLSLSLSLSPLMNDRIPSPSPAVATPARRSQPSVHRPRSRPPYQPSGPLFLPLVSTDLPPRPRSWRCEARIDLIVR